MGIGPHAIRLTRLIVQSRSVKPDFTVIELGSQDFAPTLQAVQWAMRREYGWADAETVTSVAQMYRRLGSPRYEAIDLDGAHGAHRFDLNFDLRDRHGFATEFDLVTNHGTTEHLFDQATAFRNIHRLTVPGGLMVHGLPFQGYQNHGLFNYSASFFLDLATANDYEVMGIFASVADELVSYDESWLARCPAGADVLVMAVLRRTTAGPFNVPYDGRYFAMAGNAPSATGRSAPTSRGEIWRFPLGDKLDGETPRHLRPDPAAEADGTALLRPWDGAGDAFVRHRSAAIAALAEGVAAVYGYDVEGDIVEFGTMSGGTATGLARAIRSCDETLRYATAVYGHEARRLVLLDSFEGLPQVQPNSVDGCSPHVQDGVWSAGSLQGVSPARLADLVGQHLPADRIEILPGWFSETISSLGPDRRFALIHVDSDLYQSAMDALDGLLSRGLVARGAYVYFDDWNCNRADPDLGERRAWREVVERYGITFSDEGAYGIFARRFVVHDYRGSPEPSDRRDGTEPERATVPAETPPTAGLADASAPATSTDILDHQAASAHYNEISGRADMHPGFEAVYQRCRDHSMTSAERMYALFEAVRYVQEAGIAGDIVECGVWRGGSMMVVAEALKLFGGPPRRLHLFDTFEGLPEPDANDVDLWGHAAEGWWRQRRISEASSDWARSHLDEVKANLASTGIAAESLVFVKGLVETTLPDAAPDRISILRLDTDWYASTRHEMIHLFPRLVPNGVLIIDDYGHFRGAKKAVDEYLAERRIPLLLVRIDYTGRIAIKTHDGLGEPPRAA